MKSDKTGEIMEVEPGEADWTIKVQEGLFDFWFVARVKAAHAARTLTKSSKMQDARH